MAHYGLPYIFSLTHEGLEIFSWGITGYQLSLSFNSKENYLINLNVGNIQTYFGFNIQKGVGFDLNTSVASIEYDGEYFDASVDFLTIGITYMYKDGKVKLGAGVGLIGWSFTVNIIELIELFK